MKLLMMNFHAIILVSICVCSMAQVSIPVTTVKPAGNPTVKPQGKTTKAVPPTTAEYEPPELEGTTTTAKPNTTTTIRPVVTTKPIPIVTSPVTFPATTTYPYFVQTENRLNQPAGLVVQNVGQSGFSGQQGWEQFGPTTQQYMGQFGSGGVTGQPGQYPQNYNAQTNMIPDGFYSATSTMSAKMSDIVQGGLKNSNDLQLSLAAPGPRRQDKFLDTRGAIPVVKQYVRPKNGNDAVLGSLSVGENIHSSILSNPKPVLSQRILNTRIPESSNYGGIIVSSLEKLKSEAKASLIKKQQVSTISKQQQTDVGKENTGWMSLGTSDIGIGETSGSKSPLSQPLSYENKSMKPLSSGTGGWVSMNLENKLSIDKSSGGPPGGQQVNNKFAQGTETQQSSIPFDSPMKSIKDPQLLDQGNVSPSPDIFKGGVLPTGLDTLPVSTQEFVQGSVQRSGATSAPNLAGSSGVVIGNTPTEIVPTNTYAPPSTTMDGMFIKTGMFKDNINSNVQSTLDTMSNSSKITKTESAIITPKETGTLFNQVFNKKGPKETKVVYKGKIISSNDGKNVFSYQTKGSVKSAKGQVYSVNSEIVSPVPTQLTTSTLLRELGTQTPPPTRALDPLPVTAKSAPWWQLSLNQNTVTPPAMAPISTKIFFQVPSSAPTTATPRLWSSINKNTRNANTLEFKQSFQNSFNQQRLIQNKKTQAGGTQQKTAFQRMLSKDPYLAFAIEFERLYRELNSPTTTSRPSLFDRQSLMAALLEI